MTHFGRLVIISGIRIASFGQQMVNHLTTLIGMMSNQVVMIHSKYKMKIVWAIRTYLIIQENGNGMIEIAGLHQNLFVRKRKFRL